MSIKPIENHRKFKHNLDHPKTPIRPSSGWCFQLFVNLSLREILLFQGLDIPNNLKVDSWVNMVSSGLHAHMEVKEKKRGGEKLQSSL